MKTIPQGQIAPYGLFRRDGVKGVHLLIRLPFIGYGNLYDAMRDERAKGWYAVDCMFTVKSPHPGRVEFSLGWIRTALTRLKWTNGCGYVSER